MGLNFLIKNRRFQSQYFIDRKKDVIKRGGENISPAEVERVLNEHPAVAECTVLSVPDPVREEAVLAIIRCQQGDRQPPKHSLSHDSLNESSVVSYWSQFRRSFGGQEEVPSCSRCSSWSFFFNFIFHQYKIISLLNEKTEAEDSLR